MSNCIIFGLQFTTHSHDVGPRSSVPERIGTAALSRHLSVLFCSSYSLIIFPTLAISAKLQQLGLNPRLFYLISFCFPPVEYHVLKNTAPLAALPLL